MDTSLQFTHERVDDVPLPLGFLIKLGFPQALDRHLPAHPLHLHQGLSNGWLITVWITYILSQADDCKCHVRDWAATCTIPSKPSRANRSAPSTLPTMDIQGHSGTPTISSGYWTNDSVFGTLDHHDAGLVDVRPGQGIASPSGAYEHGTAESRGGCGRG